jgi:hypothetical protein
VAEAEAFYKKNMKQMDKAEVRQGWTGPHALALQLVPVYPAG